MPARLRGRLRRRHADTEFRFSRRAAFCCRLSLLHASTTFLARYFQQFHYFSQAIGTLLIGRPHKAPRRRKPAHLPSFAIFSRYDFDQQDVFNDGRRFERYRAARAFTRFTRTFRDFTAARHFLSR